MSQMSGFKAKMHKIRFLLGSTPNPAVGAYSTPPKPWLYLRGLGLLLRGGRVKREGRGRGWEEKGGASPPVNILAKNRPCCSWRTSSSSVFSSYHVLHEQAVMLARPVPSRPRINITVNKPHPPTTLSDVVSRDASS